MCLDSLMMTTTTTTTTTTAAAAAAAAGTHPPCKRFLTLHVCSKARAESRYCFLFCSVVTSRESEHLAERTFGKVVDEMGIARKTVRTAFTFAEKFAIISTFELEGFSQSREAFLDECNHWCLLLENFAVD